MSLIHQSLSLIAIPAFQAACFFSTLTNHYNPFRVKANANVAPCDQTVALKKNRMFASDSTKLNPVLVSLQYLGI